MSAVFRITDGTTVIDLLASSPYGWHIASWEPSIAEYKNGGIWRDSPISEGRRMAAKYFGNVIESMTVTVKAGSADEMAVRTQEMRDMLEKASDYWVGRYTTEPVWLEVQAPGESNLRYAVVMAGRLGQEKNYFASPFLQPTCTPVMDELPLTLERSHWQSLPPGERECIVPLIPVSRSFVPLLDEDDAYVSETGSSIVTSSNILRVGNLAAAVYHLGVRFRNVTIPKNATILSARIILEAYTTLSTTTVKNLIYREDNVSPAVFSTYADFAARSLATISTDWTGVVAQAAGDDLTPTDVSLHVQALVDKDDWESGNDMAFFIKDNDKFPSSAGAYREYAALENVGGRHGPVLVVTWLSEEASCDDEDYGREHIVNCKQNYCPLSGVYYYDVSTTTWSENYLTGTTTPYAMGANLAAGDMFYFLIDTIYDLEAGPFDNLVFPFEKNEADLTITWEIYTGSWTSAAETDYTNDLSETGTKSVHWSPASFVAFDMGTLAGTNNPGTTGYVIRARITAVASGADGVILQDHPYTVTWPFIELPASQVPGQLPPLLEAPVYWRHDLHGTSKWFIMATRSWERGAHFIAYFNASSKQDARTASFALGTDATALTALGGAATGTGMRVSFGTTTTWASRGLWNVGATLAYEYGGRYRMLLVTAAAPAGIEARMLFSASVYTDTHFLVENATLHDIGTVDLSSMAQEGNVYGFSFALQMAGSSSTDVYAVIFVPLDEWVAEMSGSTTLGNSATNYNYLDVDSVRYPRYPVRAALRTHTTSPTDAFVEAYLSKAANPAYLQPHKRQRIYLFARDDDDQAPRMSYALSTYVLRRYLGLRGGA